MSRAANVSRRKFLAGTAVALALAEVGPAVARIPGRMGGHPLGGVPPMTATITFADNSTINFAQNDPSATNMGDYVSAVGGFTQHCVRHRASGHGDFRDAFTVFFRPDAGGSRQEVVVEYGSEWVFSTTVAPALPGGITALHLFVPPSPSLSKTSGSTSGQSGTLSVWLSYIFPDGECVPCLSSTIAMTGTDLVTVPSPPAVPGATGYAVYASYVGVPKQQAIVAIGTDWTAPTTGITTTGASHKDTSTATIYTLTVAGGGLASPVTVPVTSHWRSARWRWQSAPRPTVRAYSDLVTLKAMLPLDTTNYLYGQDFPAASTWSGPMGMGGVNPALGTEGDRAEIGFTNEWESCWLMTADSAMKTSWLAAAECSGTMPFWWRDYSTGLFPDVVNTYPYLGFINGLGSAKYLLPQLQIKSSVANFPQLDASHMPTLTFIAWMLTDDPYFLEGAQAQAQFQVSAGNLTAHNEGLPGLFNLTSPRSYAWSARDVFRMAGFAPSSPPSWLLPRSYWAGLLPNNLTYATKYVNSTTLQCSVFHAIPETNEFEGFMMSYLHITFGWAHYTGLFSSWNTVFTYSYGSRLALSDNTGASGWDYRFPVPYHLDIVDANLGASAVPATGGDYATPSTSNTPTSWTQAWNDFVLYGGPSQNPAWTDPSTWAANTLQNIQALYHPWARAALAAIAQAGNSQGLSQHTWLAAHMISDMPAGEYKHNGAGYRWAISPT